MDAEREGKAHWKRKETGNLYAYATHYPSGDRDAKFDGANAGCPGI